MLSLQSKSAVEFSSIFNPTSSQTSRIAVALGVSFASNVPVTDCQKVESS